jgi:hypothetical protein
MKALFWGLLHEHQDWEKVRGFCYLECLLARRREQGLHRGPAFCEQAGKEFESWSYEGLILGVLHEHQDW